MAARPPFTSQRARDLEARHRQRLWLLLHISGSLTAGMTLAWALYFATLGLWPAAAALSIGVISGAACIVAARAELIMLGGAIQFFGLYAIICGASVFLDLPTHAMARTTHLFLMPLAAGAYMGLRGSNPVLRHGVMLMLLSTFAFLASTSWPGTSPYALTDAVRVAGGRIDTVVAAVALFLMMAVMQADVEARGAQISDLKEALKSEQFQLYYQPQVDEHGQLTGAEALVRWIHPRKGMVSPAQFIPLAERTGLIIPMGQWVIDKACAHLAELARQPHTAHLTVSVNVSVHQIREPDFVVLTLASIERHGIDPHLLKMELTESVYAKDMDDIIAKMHALKRHGVSFALDDFGTGYSSLSYLKRLPLDQLKIDQAFVRDLLTQPGDLAIAKTIVDLGKTLHMSVIAEGVETHEQREMLHSIDCRHFQGYLYGRPAPLDALRQMAEAQTKKRGDPKVTPNRRREGDEETNNEVAVLALDQKKPSLLGS